MNQNEFKPDAYIALSNCGGIEIMLNRSNDGLYYRFNYGQDNLQDEEIFEAEIEYTTEENSIAYFNHVGANDTTPYFLDQAMRINRY